MANAITVTCPGCTKAMRAPETARGKKVRCKSCNHIFILPAAPVDPAATRAPAASAIRPKTTAPAAGDDDDGKSKPYGVVSLELTSRCPHCANEMEEGAIVCLKCGYNTQSRDFHRTRRVADVTGGDIFLWLLPGILSVIALLGLIAFDFWYNLKVPELVKNDEWLEWLGSGAIRLWVVIISMFGMFLVARFAFKRLVLHPMPPEEEL
jgi:hypothetical protein